MFFLPFFRASKNGMHLSVDLEMKRLKAATFPLRLCNSFFVLGALTSLKAVIWAGLASMPLALTMKPKNFPESTPNEHFRGLSSFCTCGVLQTSLPSDPYGPLLS